ncbi:cobalamin biosynthesis protein [Rhizobium sp. LjRoot30]|uniref:cobalamin biosynthesis protein n=1 Tax=Rhizobium sp. LjRoot30 TaxID=3342320 RepID=UPI003ECEDDAF
MSEADNVRLKHRLYVLGLGCRPGTTGDELIALAETALHQASLEHDALGLIASFDARRNDPGIAAVAGHFGLPTVFYDAARLEMETPRLKTPSASVFVAIGCHGVAESAALAAAGPAAVLILAKIRSGQATAAIAGEP